MNKKVKKFIVLVIGMIFVVVGIIGLFLPFLQGIIFLVIGLLLVAQYFPKLQIYIKNKSERYPRLHKIILKAEEYISDILGL